MSKRGKTVCFTSEKSKVDLSEITIFVNRTSETVYCVRDNKWR
jgi:hypothetical protein